MLSRVSKTTEAMQSENGFDGPDQMLLIRESMLLHKLDHPGIVKFIGINFKSLTNPDALEPSIITEYLPNGSLREILDNEKKSNADYNWTPTKKYIFLLGIAHAMRYLHSHNIIHRDLKPQNILADIDFYPRICDFGLTRCFPGSITNISMTKEIGTPLYMAPELLKGDSHYNSSVDVYAFSILAYEIVTGKSPYFELGKLTPFKLINKVTKGYRPKFTKNMTKKMKTLLSRCWDENTSERPTFDEIYKLLSTDFSFIDEEVDEDEINHYIEDIENECKKDKNPTKVVNGEKTNSSQEKSINNNNDLNCKVFSALVQLFGTRKRKKCRCCSTLFKSSIQRKWRRSCLINARPSL